MTSHGGEKCAGARGWACVGPGGFAPEGGRMSARDLGAGLPASTGGRCGWARGRGHGGTRRPPGRACAVAEGKERLPAEDGTGRSCLPVLPSVRSGTEPEPPLLPAAPPRGRAPPPFSPPQLPCAAHRGEGVHDAPVDVGRDSCVTGWRDFESLPVWSASAASAAQLHRSLTF